MAQLSDDEGPLSEGHRRGPLHHVIVHVERRLGAGILVLLPIGITILVFKFFFDLLDPVLEQPLSYLPGPHIPGLGFLVLMALVYIAGLVAAHVIGRRLIGLAHRLLEFIPLVKTVYGTTRTAVELISTNSNPRYSAVVLVEFPRPGCQAIGLVTSRVVNAEGAELLAVYIPTTPIPSSGFLIMMPSAEVRPAGISVDDAMKVVISGGILAGTVFPQHETLPTQATQENGGARRPASNNLQADSATDQPSVVS